MRIITTIGGMNEVLTRLREDGKTIGFVPTMGCFHEGHLSLMRKAREGCDIVIASIYVNPAQFGKGEDLDSYPRDLKRDSEMADRAGVDFIFAPSDQEMYPQPHLSYVNVEKITRGLCGKSRPTHFQGVATICTKLFNIIRPHKTYFGQKDYQQSLVIRQIIKDLNLDIQLVVCPIARGRDGIAMSSRNKYLDSDERKSAPVLHRSLLFGKKLIEEGEKNPEDIKEKIKEMICEHNGKIDYVEIVDPETLEKVKEIGERTLIAIAVFFGKTRLIDNILV